MTHTMSDAVDYFQPHMDKSILSIPEQLLTPTITETIRLSLAKSSSNCTADFSAKTNQHISMFNNYMVQR